MNIKAHSKHVSNHKATRQAIENAYNGDNKDLELLIFELQTHIYLQCCEKSYRTFRQWKYLTPPEIARELRDMEAPEDLNMSMPDFKPTENKPNLMKRMVNKIKDIPNQLNLWMDVA